MICPLQVILQGIMLRLLLLLVITICVLLTNVKSGVPIGKIFGLYQYIIYSPCPL